jgi:hypothetical protein
MAEAAIAADMSAVVTPVPVPVKPLPRMLHPARFSQATYATNRWSVTYDLTVPYDRMFEPDFWSHIANKLRIGDIIEVHAEDTSWFAEVYVVAAHRLSAKVVLLRRVDLAPAAEVAATASPLTVKYRGPHARYCVMRGESVVGEKFQTEAEAMVELAKLRNAFA